MNALRFSAGVWPAVRREAAFMARDRAVWVWCLVVLCLAVLAVSAVSAGLSEVGRQKATIARLVEADRADRMAVLKAQKDWGGAAYHSFHPIFLSCCRTGSAAAGIGKAHR